MAVYKETKSLPYIGAVRIFTSPSIFSPVDPSAQAHATDSDNIYSGGNLADALIRFANHLDPNGKSGNGWPRYSTSAPKNFVVGAGYTAVEDDDYRKEAMSALIAEKLKYPS